jgi:hypothetical protein
VIRRRNIRSLVLPDHSGRLVSLAGAAWRAADGAMPTGRRSPRRAKSSKRCRFVRHAGNSWQVEPTSSGRLRLPTHRASSTVGCDHDRRRAEPEPAGDRALMAIGSSAVSLPAARARRPAL